jgi:hypothetical protein
MKILRPPRSNPRPSATRPVPLGPAIGRFATKSWPARAGGPSLGASRRDSCDRDGRHPLAEGRHMQTTRSVKARANEHGHRVLELARVQLPSRDAGTRRRRGGERRRPVRAPASLWAAAEGVD